MFKKIEKEDRTKHDTFYKHSKTVAIITESEIDGVFQSIYTTIISNIKNSLGKGSGWIFDLVINRTSSISRCNSLAESSYIKFWKN